MASDAAECVWTECWDGGEWDTSCGESFVFEDGTPEENRQRFCGYCGKPLKTVRHQEEDDGE